MPVVEDYMCRAGRHPCVHVTAVTGHQLREQNRQKNDNAY